MFTAVDVRVLLSESSRRISLRPFHVARQDTMSQSFFRHRVSSRRPMWTGLNGDRVSRKVGRAVATSVFVHSDSATSNLATSPRVNYQ